MSQRTYTSVLNGGVDNTICGFKAKRLGKLRDIGVPIPNGFVINSNAYKDFFKSARLGEWLSVNIFPYLSQATHMITPEEAEEYSDKITSHIVDTVYKQQGIPPKIRYEILEAYKEIKSGPVAIRPSDVAPDEFDDPDSSKYDCFLNISGEEELIRHVVLCWARSLSPKVLYMLAERGHGYVRKFDIRDPVVMGNPAVQFNLSRVGTTPEELALPVIVQQFIPYNVTGVAHRTENGSPYISIRAIHGLCAGLILERYNSDSKESQGIVRYELDKKKAYLLKTEEDVDSITSGDHVELLKPYFNVTTSIHKSVKKAGKSIIKKMKPTILDIKLVPPPSENPNNTGGSEKTDGSTSGPSVLTLKNIRKFYELEVLKEHPSLMDTFVAENMSLYSKTSVPSLTSSKRIDNRVSTLLKAGEKCGVMEQTLKEQRTTQAPINAHEQLEIASCLLFMENMFRSSLSIEFGIMYQRSGPVLHILDIKAIPLSPSIISCTSLHSLFTQSFPNDEMSLSLATETLCSLFPFLRGPLLCRNGRLCLSEDLVFSRWFRWAIKGAPGLFNININASAQEAELLDIEAQGNDEVGMEGQAGSDESSEGEEEEEETEKSDTSDFGLVVECTVEKEESDQKEKYYEQLELKKTKKKQEAAASAASGSSSQQKKKIKPPEYIIQNRKIRRRASRKIFQGLFHSMSSLKGDIRNILKGKNVSVVNPKDTLDSTIPQPPTDFVRVRDGKVELKKLKLIDDVHVALCRIVDKINKNIESVLADVTKTIAALQKGGEGDNLRLAIANCIDLVLSLSSDKRIKDSLVAACAFDGACSVAARQVNHEMSKITTKGFGPSKLYPALNEKEIYEASIGIPPSTPHLRFGTIQSTVPEEMLDYIDTIVNSQSFKILCDTGRQTYIIFEKLIEQIVETTRAKVSMRVGSDGIVPPIPIGLIDGMAIPSLIEIIAFVDVRTLALGNLLGGLGGFGLSSFAVAEQSVEQRIDSYVRKLYTAAFAKKNGIENPAQAAKVLDATAVCNNISVISKCVASMTTNFPSRIMTMFGSFVSGIPLEMAPGCVLMAIRNRIAAHEFGVHIVSTTSTAPQVNLSNLADSVEKAGKSDDGDKSNKGGEEEGESKKKQIDEEEVRRLDMLSRALNPYLLHSLILCYHDSNISPIQNIDIYACYTILAFRHTVVSNLFQPLLIYFSHLQKQLVQVSYIAALRLNASNYLTPAIQEMMLKVGDRIKNIKIPTCLPPENCDTVNNMLSHMFLGEAVQVLSAVLTCHCVEAEDMIYRIKRPNVQRELLPADISRFVSYIHKARVLKGVANAISFSPTGLNTTNVGMTKKTRNKILVPAKTPVGVATRVLPMRAAAYDVPIVVVGENLRRALPHRTVGLALVVNPTEDPIESLRFLEPLASSINRFSKASEGRFPSVSGLIIILRGTADLSTGLELIFRTQARALGVPVLGIVCVGTKYMTEFPRQTQLTPCENEFKELTESFYSRLASAKKRAKSDGGDKTMKGLIKKVEDEEGMSLKKTKLEIPTMYPLYNIGHDLLSVTLNNDIPLLLGVSESCLCPPTPITTGSILEIHFVGSIGNEDAREVVASACINTLPEEDCKRIMASIPKEKGTRDSLIRSSEIMIPQAIIGQLDAKDFLDYVLANTSSNYSTTRESLAGKGTTVSASSVPRPPSTLMSYAMTMRQSSYRTTRMSAMSKAIGSSRPVLSFSNSSRRISSAVASVAAIRSSKGELYSSVTGHTSSLSRFYESDMNGDLLSSIRLSSQLLTPSDGTRTVSRFIRQQYSSSLGRRVIKASEEEKEAGKVIVNSYKTFALARDIKNEIKREQLLKEITSYEKDYKLAIEILRDVYLSGILEVLKKNKKKKTAKRDQNIIAVCDELMVITGEMLEISNKCNAALHEINKKWNRTERPQVMFAKMIEASLMSVDVYGRYSLDYHKYLEMLINENLPKKISKLIIEEIPDTTGNQPLDYYLIRPVQHLFRYQLISEKLLKHTSRTHPDYNDTEGLKSYIKRVLERMEGSLNSAIQAEKVGQISARVDGLDSSFVKKDRYFIKESPPMSISVLRIGGQHVRSLMPLTAGETLQIPLEISKEYKETFNKLLEPPTENCPVKQSSVSIPELPYPQLLLLLQFNDCLLIVRQITKEAHKSNSSVRRRLFRRNKKSKNRGDVEKRGTMFLPEEMGSLDVENPLKNEYYECVALMENIDTKLITASVLSGKYHQTFQLRSADTLATVYCQIFEDYIAWIQDIEKIYGGKV